MIEVSDGQGGVIQTDFYVDEDSILQPLGVVVTRDSRYEILPSIRNNTEEIPGVDGEIDFGSEFKARLLELHCATEDGLTAAEKKNLQREIANNLNPVLGDKTLVFADEPNRLYRVKCYEKIDLTEYATWFKFIISFKMNNPNILSSEYKSLTGSGVLFNAGNRNAGLLIEANGYLSNPQIIVNGEAMYFDGEVPIANILKIDTLKKTASMGSVNVVDRLNGIFPLVKPGENSISAAPTVIIKWRDEWI